MSMMKYALVFCLLAASPAIAQQAQPTVEDVQTQYLIETGQLRAALGQAQMQIKQLRSQLAEKEALSKEPSDLKAKHDAEKK